MKREYQLVAFIVLGALACSGGGQNGATKTTIAQTDANQTTQHEGSGSCGGADSLIFSNVVSDSETEDLSGEEIVLRRAGNGWSGSSREAAGEFGASMPMSAVEGSSIPGPIAFTIPDDRDTAVFRGIVYCDSLIGESREFRNTPFNHVTYKRVRR